MPERENETSLVRKNDQGLLELTEAGHTALEPIVTDTGAQVYAFRKGENTQYAAGAMARASRSSNDLRTVIASEFLTKETGSQGLLHRVITGYGDDSVAQLDHDQLVLEGISNVLTKKVQRGRVAIGYLEQSTRYLRFDVKDSEDNYKYVVPGEFDTETAEEYTENVDEIFDIYSELYLKAFEHIKATSSVPKEDQNRAWETACHAQACDAVRGLLPAATKSTVGVAGSAQAIYNMILHLESEPLPEAKHIGAAALDAVRVVNPVFYERADNPNRGGLVSTNKAKTRADSRALAEQLIETYTDDIELETGPSVKLLSYEGTENQLLAKILTDHSDVPYEQWLGVVGKLDDEKKTEILDTYVGERDNRRVKPGRATELLQYFFEIQCDIGAYRDIQRHRLVDAFDAQNYQPYLGHDRPALVDEIGGAELYEKAFEKSQETYELLKERGYEEQAQYAVLFGHNIRFSFAMNARELFHSAELRTAVQGHPSYRKVYQEIVEQVEEVHPFITRYMKFLNTDDNAELARLDAERAKEQRLQALGEA